MQRVKMEVHPCFQGRKSGMPLTAYPQTNNRRVMFYSFNLTLFVNCVFSGSRPRKSHCLNSEPCCRDLYVGLYSDKQTCGSVRESSPVPASIWTTRHWRPSRPGGDFVSVSNPNGVDKRGPWRSSPSKTWCRIDVGLMLAHRLRRWASISPTSIQKLLFAERECGCLRRTPCTDIKAMQWRWKGS